MLKMFQIEKTFNKLRVSLIVEPWAKGNDKAHITITYNRHIVINGLLQNADQAAVLTPESAERYLSETIGERGSRVESWEHHYKVMMEQAKKLDMI